MIEIMDPKSPSGCPSTPGSVHELAKKFSFNSPPQSEPFATIVFFVYRLFVYTSIFILFTILLWFYIPVVYMYVYTCTCTVHVHVRVYKMYTHCGLLSCTCMFSNCR